MNICEIVKRVKSASLKLAAVHSGEKNKALMNIAEALLSNKEKIFEANRNDILRSEAENIPGPLLKRLKFDEGKLADVIDGIRSLAKFEDPVGKTLLSTELDEGLELYKVTCPIGVIGIIFGIQAGRARTDFTLCLKSGNGYFKGRIRSQADQPGIVGLIISASESSGIPAGWCALLETRSDISELLKQDEYVGFNYSKRFERIRQVYHGSH